MVDWYTDTSPPATELESVPVWLIVPLVPWFGLAFVGTYVWQPPTLGNGSPIPLKQLIMMYFSTHYLLIPFTCYDTSCWQIHIERMYANLINHESLAKTCWTCVFENLNIRIHWVSFSQPLLNAIALCLNAILAIMHSLGQPKLPKNFEEDTWSILKDAITAIFLKQKLSCDVEKLYQVILLLLTL